MLLCIGRCLCSCGIAPHSLHIPSTDATAKGYMKAGLTTAVPRWPSPLLQRYYNAYGTAEPGPRFARPKLTPHPFLYPPAVREKRLPIKHCTPCSVH